MSRRCTGIRPGDGRVGNELVEELGPTFDALAAFQETLATAGSMLVEAEHGRDILRTKVAELEAERKEAWHCLRDLLGILDSKHIRYCETMAHEHGYALDKTTSERYCAMIKRARAQLPKKD